MFCRNCGSPIQEGYSHCFRCSYDDTSPFCPPRSPPKLKSYSIWVVSAALVVSLIAGSVLYYQWQDAKATLADEQAVMIKQLSDLNEQIDTLQNEAAVQVNPTPPMTTIIPGGFVYSGSYAPGDTFVTVWGTGSGDYFIQSTFQPAKP